MNVEKLKRLQAQVRIGGKGTPRRKKKVIHQTAVADDKKLQSSLKKLSVSTIPGIEEVNIIKDDLTVIHFNNPKAQASLSANTFAVTGHGETKKIVEMLPEILPQLGQETVVQLRMFANSMSNNQQQQQQQQQIKGTAITAAAAVAGAVGGGNIGEHILSSVLEEDIDDNDDDMPMLVSDFDEVAKLEADNQKITKKSEDLKNNAIKVTEPPVVHENKDNKIKENKEHGNKKTEKNDDKSKKKEQNKNNNKNDAAKIKETKNNNTKEISKQQQQQQQQFDVKTKNQTKIKLGAEQNDNNNKVKGAQGVTNNNNNNKQQQIVAPIGADKENKETNEVIAKNIKQPQQQQQQQQQNNKKQNQQKSQQSQPPQLQGTVNIENKEQLLQLQQQQSHINLQAANLLVAENKQQEPPKALNVEEIKQTVEIVKPTEIKDMKNETTAVVTGEIKQNEKNNNQQQQQQQQQQQMKSSNKDKKSVKSNIKDGKVDELKTPIETKKNEEIKEPIAAKLPEIVKVETASKSIDVKNLPESKAIAEKNIEKNQKLEGIVEKSEIDKNALKKTTGNKKEQKKGKTPEPKPENAKKIIELPAVPIAMAVAKNDKPLIEFKEIETIPSQIKETPEKLSLNIIKETPEKQLKQKSPNLIKEIPEKQLKEKSPNLIKETTEKLPKDKTPNLIKEAPEKQPKEKSPNLIKEAPEKQPKEKSLSLEAAKNEEVKKTSPTPDAEKQIELKLEKIEIKPELKLAAGKPIVSEGNKNQIKEAKTIEAKPKDKSTTNEGKNLETTSKAKSPVVEAEIKKNVEQSEITPAKDTKSPIITPSSANLEINAPEAMASVIAKSAESKEPIKIVESAEQPKTEPQPPLMIMPAPIIPMIMTQPEIKIEAKKNMPQEKIDKKSTPPPKQQPVQPQQQQQQVVKKPQDTVINKEGAIQTKMPAAVSAPKSDNNKPKQASPSPMKPAQRPSSKSPAKGQQQQPAKTTASNMAKKSPEKTGPAKAASPAKTASPATTQGAVKKSTSPPKTSAEEIGTKKITAQKQQQPKPIIDAEKPKQVPTAAAKQQKKPTTPTTITTQAQLQNEVPTLPKNN